MFANICEYCCELSGSVQKSENRLGWQLGSWSRPAVGGGTVISQQLDCWSLDWTLDWRLEANASDSSSQWTLHFIMHSTHREQSSEIEPLLH